MEVQIPHWRGNFMGGNGRPIVKYSTSAVSCAKTGEPIERDAIWDLDSRWPMEACIRWGAHWRMPLNHPRVAVMQPTIILLWLTVTIKGIYKTQDRLRATSVLCWQRKCLLSTHCQKQLQRNVFSYVLKVSTETSVDGSTAGRLFHVDGS